MGTDKKQSALDAAIDLFGAQGFDNTSTQSVAKHAGIGTGTLFKYFESKDDLIRASYLSAKLEMIAACREDLDPSSAFEPMLRTIWKNIFDWCIRHPNKHSFILQIASSRFLDAEIENKIEAEMLFFKVAVKAAQDNGSLIDAPLELISGTIWSMLNMAIQFNHGSCHIEESSVYELLLNSLKIKRN